MLRYLTSAVGNFIAVGVFAGVGDSVPPVQLMFIFAGVMGFNLVLMLAVRSYFLKSKRQAVMIDGRGAQAMDRQESADVKLSGSINRM